MDRRRRDALASIVGAEHVLSAREDREDHALDAYGSWRYVEQVASGASVPDVVVRPGSAEEVQAVLHFAADEGCAVTPHGGGTGVMGAAVPMQRGVVLDLRRMNRLRHVDTDAMIAVVEAGALLGDLDDALARRGLMLGHDPWSRPLATVGGAVSTDGVGYLAAAYGSMGDQVLGLEAALATGELLDARAVSLRAGPRLDHALIGAEGTLGVITATVLRVFPRPEARSVHAVRFASFAAGFGAIGAMARAGVRPSMIDLTEERGERGRLDTTLYLCFEGTCAVEQVLRTEGLRLCREHGGRLLEGVGETFWKQRHDPAARWAERTEGGRRLAVVKEPSAPSFDYLHLSLPGDGVLAFRDRCEERLAAEGFTAREYAVWGRPDLFSVAFGAPPGAGTDVTPVSLALIDEAQRLGGSMEYCHGVGLKLRDRLAGEGRDRLSALRSIKRALDPAGILNPGKLSA